MCTQADPLALNPCDVVDALESLGADVNEESIESVSEEIGTMRSIMLEDLLLILKRCGITPAQCMRMRRILERKDSKAEPASPVVSLTFDHTVLFCHAQERMLVVLICACAWGCSG